MSASFTPDIAHQLSSKILRAYDIRGVVGETLSTQDAYWLGRVFASWAIEAGHGNHPLNLGRDGRLSSPALRDALAKGINDQGMDVRDLGIVPTPLLYDAVFHLPSAGGIMITGSHNPPDHNGFKMMMGLETLFGEKVASLADRLAKLDRAVKGNGKILSHDHHADYIGRMIDSLSWGRKMKLVMDPGNGAMGNVAIAVGAALLQRGWAEVTVINGDIDGRFPAHHPDPSEEKNLQQLKEAVAAKGTDLGLAFDGDGDRIGIVAPGGHVFWGDQMLMILARDILPRHKGQAVIADVKASQAFFDEVARLGGNPIMAKTGHSFIKDKMKETGAILAGEMSGHIFIRDGHKGFDDGMYAGLRLAAFFSRQDQNADQIFASLPKAYATPEFRVTCPDEKKQEVIDGIAATLAGREGIEIITIDGLRVVSPVGWWLIRASNTQPVLSLRAEGQDEASCAALKDELFGLLAPYGIGEV